MDNLEMPRTLDDWKAYIAEATEMEKQADRTKIDAVIEKGRRIIEFHAAFKASGQKWGQRWDDVCRKVVGLSDSTCGKYELIAKNLRHGVTDISFPSNLENLYFLARAAAADRQTFDEAAKAGVINPTMKNQQSASIARKAEAKANPRKPKPTKRSGMAVRLVEPTYVHLTPTEVDPEFTGTRTEWIDKYGHVQAMTAEEYARMRFSSWVFNIRALVSEAKKQPGWPNVDHNWLRSPKERDICRLAEALDYLRPKIAEAEALLARAKEAKGEVRVFGSAAESTDLVEEPSQPSEIRLIARTAIEAAKG